MVACAEDLGHLLFRKVEVGIAAHLKREHEFAHVVAAVDHRRRGERDHHDVILIVAERAALFLEDSDYRERVTVDLNDFADRFATQLERVDDLQADNADALLRFVVERSEEAAVLDPVVHNLLVCAAHRIKLRRMDRVAVLHLRLADENRRPFVNRGRGAPYCLRVVDGQIGKLLQKWISLLSWIGIDLDERGADTLEILRDFVLHPLDERYDGDHRCHSDHHA